MNDEYQTRQFFGNCDTTHITHNDITIGMHWVINICQRNGIKVKLNHSKIEANFEFPFLFKSNK